MENYIGIIRVEANPEKAFVGDPEDPEKIISEIEGYRVTLPDFDDYETWFPKDIFDKAFFKVDNSEKLNLDEIRKQIKPV